MVIDAGETEILVRLRPHDADQLVLGGRRIEGSRRDLIQEILQLFV
jgi:hypothetical protein